MKKILIYTFFGYYKQTSKILYSLDLSKYEIDKLYIPNRFSTKKLISLIPKYDSVVGIADHNRNATKSRFDSVYVNKYAKRILIEDSPEYCYSNLSIELPPIFYKYEKTTNGPCNRSAYLVMEEINKGNLKTKFGFFHLCKTGVERDIKQILEILS